VQWNRLQNPPSIPSHENVFGYEENVNGELIKQKNADKMHTGVKEDRVGPGEYNVQGNIAEKRTGPKWHLQKGQRKNAGEALALPPGPGHYNSEKTDIFPIYKYKPSSVFVSKVNRDS